MLNNKSFEGNTREFTQKYDVDVQDDKNLRLKGKQSHFTKRKIMNSTIV